MSHMSPEAEQVLITHLTAISTSTYRSDAKAVPLLRKTTLDSSSAKVTWPAARFTRSPTAQTMTRGGKQARSPGIVMCHVALALNCLVKSALGGECKACMFQPRPFRCNNICHGKPDPRLSLAVGVAAVGSRVGQLNERTPNRGLSVGGSGGGGEMLCGVCARECVCTVV